MNQLNHDMIFYISRFCDKDSLLNLRLVNKTCKNGVNSYMRTEDSKTKVNWMTISATENLSESFMETFAMRLNWWTLSSCQKFSIEFLRMYSDKVVWRDICIKWVLSDSIIREFSDKVDWYWLCECQLLSTNIIREFKDRIYWTSIGNQPLSEEIMREFYTFLCKDQLSRNQILTEAFMWEFRADLNWQYIKRFQTLKPEFLKKVTERGY